MSCALDEITKVLAGLSLGNSCLQSLESLRLLLSQVPDSELREYVPKIDIDRLFTCLNTSDKDQKQLACDILYRILSCMPPGRALDRYEDMFLEGLSHPENLVKELILRELQLAANDQEVSHQLASKVELLLSCLRLIGSDDSGIAGKASRVLAGLAARGEAANVLVSPPLVEEMRVVSRKNDTVRFRIYDLVVALCCASEGMLAVCEESQLVQPFLDEASNSRDILVQLNALELLKTLVSVQHGRDYLQRQGTIQKLANSLNQATSDPLASLIVPGLMKFFGALAHFQPGIMEEIANFTDSLFNLIDDPDLVLSVIAIETLSFISTGPGGKAALSRQGSRMDGALRRIGFLLTNSNGEIRIKTLHCVSELLRLPSDQLGDEALLSIVQGWFHQLDPKPIALMTGITKQPFSELRLGALTVFLELSAQPWAQTLMSQQPGFLEFLLDRRSEPDKECLERKFEIVKSLCESASDSWSPHALAQMREHVREGPWFVRGQSSVAFESGP